MPGDETIFREAKDAIGSGDSQRARELLTRLIKNYPTHAEYWVWLSATVDTTKERGYCLKEALRLDPQNTEAQRGLIIMGELPLDSRFIIPYSVQRLGMKKKTHSDQAGWTQKAGRARIWVGISLTGLLVVIAAIYLTNSNLNRNKPVIPADLFLTPFPSLTPSPKTTDAPVRLKTDIFKLQSNSTPLPFFLETTYTPTPLYVNTPHTRVEAYRNAINTFRRSDLVHTLDYLQQALALEPDSVDIIYHIGEIHRLQQNFDKAGANYDIAIMKNNRFAPAYLGRARARLGLSLDRSVLNTVPPERWRNVGDDLQKAAEFDPNYLDAQVEMALFEISQGNPEKALDRLDRAARLAPGSPLVFLTQAQANLRAGKYNIAYENAKKASSLDATLLSAYRVQGEALLFSDLPGQAIEPLRLYTLYVPSDGQAWLLLGKAYETRQNTDQAFDAYIHSSGADKTLLEAYFLRGEIFINRSDLVNARKEAEEALRVNRDSPEAHILRGRILYLQKDNIGAALELDQAEKLSRTALQKAQVYYYRAAVQNARGLTVQEIKDLTALLNLPEGSAASEWLEYSRQRLQSLATTTPTPARTAGITPTPPSVFSSKATATDISSTNLTATPTASTTSAAMENSTSDAASIMPSPTATPFPR